MKIITAYPVIVNKKVVNRKNDFCNLDAKSGPAAIKQFQTWSNKIKGTKLVVDGKWGPKTAAAYKTNGADFEKAYTDTASTLAGMFGPTAGTPATTGNLSTTDPSGNTKSGQFWDKAKGLWIKASDAGLVDKAKGFLQNKIGGGSGVNQTGQDTMQTTPDTSVTDTGTTDTSTGKKKIFTPMNIGIGVGVIVLLYVGYRLMKGGSASKAKA